MLMYILSKVHYICCRKVHNEKNIAHNIATWGLKKISLDTIHYVLSTERIYKNCLNGDHGSTVFSFVYNIAVKVTKEEENSHRLDSQGNQVLKDNLVSSSPANRLQRKTCGRALSFLQRLVTFQESRQWSSLVDCPLPKSPNMVLFQFCHQFDRLHLKIIYQKLCTTLLVPLFQYSFL